VSEVEGMNLKEALAFRPGEVHVTLNLTSR